MATKKLVNDTETCVDENLQGFVAVNPGLQILSGHRVVVRADIEDVRADNKVTLLSGGGSGHEPAHAGYVGPGMLSAAVAGSVFASPPPSSILAAIKAITSPAGTLVIVKNYTGDRLNFGLAAERAKTTGLNVELLVVAEDCALTSADMTAGRRGLAGTVFIHKIAGAMAEAGKSLAGIVEVCQKASLSMGTMGVCLSPCSLPGHAPSFQLLPDEIEFGLGIHGEPGVKRHKMMSAKETVKIMIDHMTSMETSTHISVTQGDAVALMVNNLGGTSVLEMNVIAKEAIEYLESKNVVVQRAYCGSFMTSLEMAGISLTVLHADTIITTCLDAETRAPGWFRPLLPSNTNCRTTPTVMPSEGSLSQSLTCKDSVTVSPEITRLLHKAVSYACEALGNCENQLNKLDSSAGDGDCGSTLKRGTTAIRSQLGSSVESSALPVSCPANLLLSLAHICESVMGGSSGALYSLFFTAASSSLSSDVSVRSWLTALQMGNAAIMKYANAKPGYRTMLDSLCAAEEALGEKMPTQSPLEAFQFAVQAAENAAIQTATMKASAGRSSYVNPDLLTEPDPGAHAVGIWMRAACEACKLHT